MWFAIVGTDVPDSLEKRKAVRPAHIARLEKLLDEGRLLVAGAFPAIESEDPGPAGFTGSLILAQFASQAEAEAWAKDDPYVAAGVYAQVSIKPFRKALPAA
ncbi:YciI family protein [Dyella sp. ASV21]|uniref:YciI family protein n=1 Tax=Dyella sp. ASV21 TaxID=2795114 RepID=UPI0018EE35E6|nr:YciI family protein [Dyella sp. ASV21]